MAYTFDTNAIANSLRRMDSGRCLAFGIFLFERALPGFLQFQVETNHVGGGELRGVLAQCWQALETNRLPRDRLVDAASCQQLMPDSEAYVSPYTSAAIDAVNISCGLLSYLEHSDIQFLLEAAEARRDTIDLFIQNHVDVGGTGENEIAGHPLMQEELRYIYSDLAFLGGLPKSGAAVFASVLDRAIQLDYRKLRLKV